MTNSTRTLERMGLNNKEASKTLNWTEALWFRWQVQKQQGNKNKGRDICRSIAQYWICAGPLMLLGIPWTLPVNIQQRWLTKLQDWQQSMTIFKNETDQPQLNLSSSREQDQASAHHKNNRDQIIMSEQFLHLVPRWSYRIISSHVVEDVLAWQCYGCRYRCTYGYIKCWWCSDNRKRVQAWG